MAATSPSKNDRERVALLNKYEEFINLKLKPNLKATLDARDVIFDTISE